LALAASVCRWLPMFVGGISFSAVVDDQFA